MEYNIKRFSENAKHMTGYDLGYESTKRIVHFFSETVQDSSFLYFKAKLSKFWPPRPLLRPFQGHNSIWKWFQWEIEPFLKALHIFEF